jgi:Uma2 family endonuclease
VPEGPAWMGSPACAKLGESPMGNPAPKRASYEDLLALPSNQVGEIIDGVLYTQPRPATRHARASTVLGEELGPPFGRGRGGGPGGWVLLDEPELHLGPEPDILVPDLAGWRRERMPELPDAAFLTLPPDWACEVLSDSTRAHDRVRKLPVYAREGVSHVWLVDPLAKTLEVFRLDGDGYRLVVTFEGETPCRAEPFDAIELDLAALWQR